MVAPPPGQQPAGHPFVASVGAEGSIALISLQPGQQGLLALLNGQPPEVSGLLSRRCREPMPLCLFMFPGACSCCSLHACQCT